MAGALIVYFGPDDSLRVPVLERAGFRVERCETLDELARILDAPDLDGVICAEEPGRPANQAAELVRSVAGLPKILFQHPATVSSENLFDLVILPGTAPTRWVDLVRELVHNLRQSTCPETRNGAESAWSEIARDLRAMRRGISGVGHTRDERRDAPGPGGIQHGKRSCT